MLRLADSLWTRLGQLRPGWRWAAKCGLFALVLLVVLFPRPDYLWRHIQNISNVEALIQPDLPEMAAINEEIDGKLAPGASRQEEFKVVERYVYEQIKYQYDWHNWGNLDYWPTAAEVWSRRREDCDGRAVLAVSILRSRGFVSAKLVGNLSHVWVSVDQHELMGPHQDIGFRRDHGKTFIALPTTRTLLISLAHIHKFPVVRSLLIFFAAALLCYHPCRHLGGFFAVSTVGLTGFLLLLDWAGLHLAHEIEGVNSTLMSGVFLLAFSLVCSLLMPLMLASRTAKPVPEVAPEFAPATESAS